MDTKEHDHVVVCAMCGHEFLTTVESIRKYCDGCELKESERMIRDRHENESLHPNMSMKGMW